MGLWQFTCDPAAGTVDIAQIRGADMHLNALKFLEPPMNLYLTLESPPKYTGNVLDVDIGLRHPFLGQVQFTGFDACGIFISQGSVTGFPSDPHLKLPGSGDTRLLNADGYTRWWNPTEFPPNPDTPIFGYKDGLLGTPDEMAHFSATLNGYKYFADSLQPDDPVSVQGVETRGVFSPGQKNVRHYKIKLDGGLVFNYAIDANWSYPLGNPPYHAPDDFPPNANRPEAWNISVKEIENTLAYEDSVGAGHLLLNIDVYDWFDAETNQVTAESLTGISPVTASSPIGGGEGYSTYELDLPGTSLTMDGKIELLITVQSDKTGYQGILPGETISAYFIHATEVSGIIPQGLVWILDDEQLLTDTINMDRTPSIHQRTTYDIDIGFTRLQYIPDYDNSVANCHMLTSNDNGGSFTYKWIGNAYHYGQTLKDLKVCQDPLGYSTFMYQSFLDWGETMYQHASFARDPSCPFGENEGIYLTWTQHADEVIYAADNKILCFGDRDGVVMYKKGTDPYSLYYNHSWTDWFNAPETIIAQYPAYVSETRSICKDAAGAIHLAYFGGQDGVWIKMLTNSDGLGTSWDEDVDINDGSSDEYASRIEPSLIIDPDGEYHATFIGIIGDVHAILYTKSNDGDIWPAYEPIFTNPDGYLGQVTVDAFKIQDNMIIVVSFEMEGEIWFISSLDDGATFSEPVKISDSAGNALEPDIRADAQGYVHFAWSQFHEELGKVDSYKIHYRRAHLEQE